MKVLAKKGVKSVYAITCDSREWMTVLCCVNAAGQSIPTYYIFKGSRITSNHIQDCEEGAAMAMQKKVWITRELFKAWLQHFDNAITKSIGKDIRHLLILDGHGNHVSLEVVEQAQAAGIDIMTLPAHTSHKLQPLDVSVFKSLKVQFRKKRDIWQRRTTSRQASKAELASIVAKAIKTSFTESNIKAGFETTGIWPFIPSAVDFKGMPCNHISLIDNSEQVIEEEVSQVPTTPLQDQIEDEAIMALNDMATQFEESMFAAQADVRHQLSFTQLLEQEDIMELGEQSRRHHTTSHAANQQKKVFIIKMPPLQHPV
ncbi:hypothetical protein GOP47_0013895 [Adiantum capillus-veneris]|uniref:DDE-1 domain-containing protein n=1 Tax=Adiantum capillus-veneris TaxID=13818 RepID=A0A9D4UPE0_ADICA|nr:hypothetical protein GOP47_0013895 [Adiantum capillus-veneris]